MKLSSDDHDHDSVNNEKKNYESSHNEFELNKSYI